jgi:hypothetical protein
MKIELQTVHLEQKFIEIDEDTYRDIMNDDRIDKKKIYTKIDIRNKNIIPVVYINDVRTDLCNYLGVAKRKNRIVFKDGNPYNFRKDNLTLSKEGQSYMKK